MSWIWPVSSYEVGPLLCKALGLDQQMVEKLVIVLDQDEPVRVYAKIQMDGNQGPAVLDALKPLPPGCVEIVEDVTVGADGVDLPVVVTPIDPAKGH